MAKTDSSLRFYYEVLKLERLHYGLWDEKDSLSFEGLKKAQERYEGLLIEAALSSAAASPDVRVLDAGCGSGEMVKSLLKLGYSAEGLSPDAYQEEIFRKKTDAAFHSSRFEDFNTDKKYGIIIMSESAQYMPLRRLFKKAGELIKPGGHLIVSDYFTKNGAEGPQAKSGHNINKFKIQADEDGFEIIREENLTDKTAPTLEFALSLVNGYIIPSAGILSERLDRKHPLLFRAFKRIFKNKILKVKESTALIDPDEFKKNKLYMLFVFRKRTV